MSDHEIQEIRKMVHEKKCCSSIIVQMGLSLKGERNDQMVREVSALCKGLQCGLLCGTLTGGVMMLHLFSSSQTEATEMIKELVEWFESIYGEKYGGINCIDITNLDQQKIADICPSLIEKTYSQAKNILVDYGKLEDS